MRGFQFPPVLVLVLLAAIATADPLVITEVVTDPQGDHSENAGGNGVVYDTVPGTGTVSSVDEFVEVYNASSTTVDLRGYLLEFADSTPSGFLFGTTTGILRYSAGSSLEALLPGGAVVLGNPPGTLNNAIEIRLVGPDGQPVDVMTVENGNASSAANEAVARLWNGTSFGNDVIAASITPLTVLAPPPAPDGGSIPEPALAGLVLSAACGLAIRRRASRGPCRRRSSGPR